MSSTTQAVMPICIIAPGGEIDMDDKRYKNTGTKDVYLGFFSLEEDPIPMSEIKIDA